ncbi:hypothetical protein [Streptomyces sp. NBC_00829]|uniref:hypothetical protein n=1 Tax=Streptomyces sp. NBC_00829 TaxID=2903679 RepID=UPI0038682C41|nr:hypothetical protein OG293_34235 [Streptomyces sp. NBC_00829]
MRAKSTSAARTGAFIAVAAALFCIQVDFFTLNPAVPGISHELGVTPSAAHAIALAATASAITAMTPERPPQDVYDAILRFGGVVTLAASFVVMAVRHRLVVRGRVPPLSLHTPWPPVEAGGGSRGQRP